MLPSATLFSRRIFPEISVVITPSPILRKVTANCSFSSAQGLFRFFTVVDISDHGNNITLAAELGVFQGPPPTRKECRLFFLAIHSKD